VETNIFANMIPVSFESTKDSTQITVYNNKKMYNLLSTVIHKRKLQKENRAQDNIDTKIDVLWQDDSLMSKTEM